MRLLSVNEHKINRQALYLQALLLFAIFFFLATGGALASETNSVGSILFGTREFRTSVKSLPQWIRIVNLEKAKSTFAAIQGTKASGWVQIKEKLQSATTMEKIKSVNTFFNRWPYRTDMENWGKSDYWETPKEFITKSGDCEDYSIVKYYALKDLGVPTNTMRIVVLKDVVRGLDHAILAVQTDGKYYILDNVSGAVFTDTKLKQYKPYYSVNEEYRWVHLPPNTGNPNQSVFK